MNEQKHGEANKIQSDLRTIANVIDRHYLDDTVYGLMFEYRLDEFRSITSDIRRSLKNIEEQLKSRYESL